MATFASACVVLMCQVKISGVDGIDRGRPDGDIMEYRGGKIGRRGMLAAAGSFAVWDSSATLGATAAPPQSVPALAQYIDHLRSPTGGEMVGTSNEDSLQSRLDAISIDVLDYCGGYAAWIALSDVGAIIQDAVDDAVTKLAAGTCRSATIALPPATAALPWTSAVLIDDPHISLAGSGSQTTRFNCTGSGIAHLTVACDIAKFSTFFGSSVQGLRLIGNATASNKGLVMGDMVGAYVFDIVATGFTGTGAIGVHFLNVNYWFERNTILRVHVDGCTTGLQITGGGTTPTASFGYNNFLGLTANANAGQVALRLTSNSDIYNSQINFICNVVDAGTVVKLEGTAHIRDCWGGISGEQTFGTGGAGWNLANGTSARFFGRSNLDGLSNVIAAAIGRAPPLQVINNTALAGSAPQMGGQGTLSYNGVTVAPYPLMTDKPEDAYAEHGFLIGPGLVSPYVAMFNSPGNGFGVFRRSFGSDTNALAKVGEVSVDGNFEASRAHTTPMADGGNYYAKPTIPTAGTFDLPYRIQGGLLVLRDGAAGGVGVYRVDESAGVALISGDAQFVVGTAAANQIGVSSSGVATTISNGYGADRLVHAAIFGAQIA